MLSRPDRNTCIDWLLQNNTKYHLTITFKKYTPDKECRRLLNRFIKHLNRSIFKKRYDSGKSFIKGFAIQEYTHSMETSHFHLLIASDDWLPSIERLEQLIRRKVSYFRRSNSRYCITDYLLQAYYNDGNNKLERYLTKQFEFNRSNSFNNIGWLSDKDIYFGDINDY